MERQLIIPDYHVILVHFPLALIAAGTFIELFAFLWRRSSFRQAGRWMLLVGIMSAIPAFTSGLYAARIAMSGEEFTRWTDLMNSQQLSPHAWRELRDHFTFNAIAVGIFSLLLVSWLGASDRVRRQFHLLYLIVLLFGLSIVTVSAWHGGELVFRYGVGQVAAAEAPAPTLPTTEPSTHPATIPTSVPVAVSTSGDVGGGERVAAAVQRVIPPIQAHVIMAGWVIAFSLAALGLSIRQISMAPDPHGDEAKVDQQLADALQPGRPLADAPQFSPEHARSSLLADAELTPPLVPPARFWMITLLLAVITVFIGVTLVGIYNVNDFREFLNNSRRATAHAILGASVVVLSLILAGVTRWGARNKGAVFLFTLLILLVLAAQVWVGILMLFDGNDGGMSLLP